MSGNRRFDCGRFSLMLGGKTYVMGVLNLTPDSFSDGGLYNAPEAALARAAQMEAEGADILDVGGQSTRPGHSPVTADEEWERLAPVLDKLCAHTALPVSVDTYYPEVARRALACGVSIVNDVSGQVCGAMLEIVAAHSAGYIAMHTGSGGDAGHTVGYPQGVIADVRGFFAEVCATAAAAGVSLPRLCLDVGIGFGKTHAENLTLLRELAAVRSHPCALFVGASRKRVVAIPSGVTDPQARLGGTIAAHTAAIAGGADIIRVHDVAQSVQAAKVADAIYRAKEERERG